MTEKKVTPQKLERDKALDADRRKILNLPPEKALDAIAEHPYPVTLVQSLAEEDLYILVHRIGLDEALPVIGLASNQQWDYLLDMEIWEQDHVHPHRMTQWLGRLCKADADRFTHWIANEKQDDVALYLWRNIELHIREYEQDPGEIPADFHSEDQTYYVRMRPYPKAQENRQAERDLFVKDLLNRMSVFDYNGYRDALLSSTSIIPAETEEELYRQRSVRLAERGLLPFDEAIGVYQPLKVADLLNRSQKAASFQGRIVDAYPLPIHPRRAAADANLFTQILSQISDAATLERLQAEFAGLCNQVIAADQEKIQEKQILDKIVEKVGGYISIGLEEATAQMNANTPYAGVELVQNHLLSDIFRVGYGCALALKWRAEKWHRASWSNVQGLPITFWGESFMGTLGGLLIKKPLYHDNYATGVLYREFATLADIEKIETVLNRIIAFDDLISLMSVDVRPLQEHNLLTYENLLLTLWANHHLNISARPGSIQPLTMTQFGRLWDELWQPGTPPLKISDTMREIFLGWLADSGGLEPHEISQRMAPALEQLFVKIENELGNVKKKDLDKRFITLFLFAGQQ